MTENTRNEDCGNCNEPVIDNRMDAINTGLLIVRLVEEIEDLKNRIASLEAIEDVDAGFLGLDVDLSQRQINQILDALAERKTKQVQLEMKGISKEPLADRINGKLEEINHRPTYLEGRHMSCEGKKIFLRGRLELALFKYLLENPDRLVEYHELADGGVFANSQAVQKCGYRLQGKLRKLNSTTTIHTVNWHGLLLSHN